MQYPNNIKKSYTKLSVSHSNRGMNLESALNSSNEYYLRMDKALIYKKPTPIGVVDVSYKNHKKIIEKAYFKEQSTLDYNGLYRGKYIEFDAKETLNKTSSVLLFPDGKAFGTEGAGICARPGQRHFFRLHSGGNV